MLEHNEQVVQVLVWMIITVGAGLLSLLIWIGRRIQFNVDQLPETISKKVGEVHRQLVKDMGEIKDTISELERDIRAEHSNLDRRVVILEVKDQINGTKP